MPEACKHVTLQLTYRRHTGREPRFAALDAADLPLTKGRVWAVGYRPGGGLFAVGRAKGIGKPRRYVSLHRLIMGATRAQYVYARNGDLLDCRRDNLVAAPWAQRNAEARARTNKTGYRGVALIRSGKYQARLYQLGNYISGGTFVTAEDAARAYDALVTKHRGAAATRNFPDEQGEAP